MGSSRPNTRLGSHAQNYGWALEGFEHRDDAIQCIFQKVSKFLCKWSGWEKATVEAEKTVRSLCVGLDETMVLCQVLVAEDEKA